MPLFLCCALLSGVGGTFVDEKAMPQTKNGIKGKSTVQDNTMSCNKLGRVQGVFREEIAGLFISFSGVVKPCILIVFLKLIERN